MEIYGSVGTTTGWPQQGPHGECLDRVRESSGEFPDSGAAQSAIPSAARPAPTAWPWTAQRQTMIRWALSDVMVPLS